MMGPIARLNSPMAEFDLIDAIRRAACSLGQDGVVMGIGDDGAVLQPSPGWQLVACVDTLVAGVHFPLATSSVDVGYKAMIVNFSDLAAMGAQPRWALASLTLETIDGTAVAGLVGGLVEAAAEYGVALVGGDTTAGPYSVSITALGEVPQGQALRRQGAQVGHRIGVTGYLGDAALALALHREGLTVAQQLRARLDRPTARVEAGRVLRGLASACIDISDGLLADLGHILQASAVGARIWVDRIPLSPAYRALPVRSDRDDLPLTGGDDYELCFTFAEEHAAAVAAALARAHCAWSDIGQVEVGRVLSVVGANGDAVDFARQGYEHFR